MENTPQPGAARRPMTHTAQLTPSPDFIAQVAQEKHKQAVQAATQSSSQQTDNALDSTAGPGPMAQPNAYKDPRQSDRPSWAHESDLREAEATIATTQFAELVVMVVGLLSTSSYLVILFLVKNTWATVGISLSLAFIAVYLAVTNYNKTARLTPYGVMGLSAATITLVFLLNMLVNYAVLRSFVS